LATIIVGAPRARWEAAAASGEYRPEDLECEGFIHASTPAQYPAVARKHYRDRRDLVLLLVDATKVRAEVRYEGRPGGHQYPHIYGPLNCDAVLQVIPYEPDAAGDFPLPPTG
jgi:uncharacterized protein (DUF952 family)